METPPRHSPLEHPPCQDLGLLSRCSYNCKKKERTDRGRASLMPTNDPLWLPETESVTRQSPGTTTTIGFKAHFQIRHPLFCRLPACSYPTRIRKPTKTGQLLGVKACCEATEARKQGRRFRILFPMSKDRMEAKQVQPEKEREGGRVV
eukprot:c27125_g1_i2 orf=1215-1661(+)